MTEITQADLGDELTATYLLGCKDGAEKERAAIVAYFRHIAKCIRLDADEGLWYPLTECDVQDAIDQYDHCAEWIEEGEHLKSQMPSNLIPKPDPLVEVMRDCGFMDINAAVDELRAELAKRGLEIREKE